MGTAYQSTKIRGLMGAEVIVRRVIACEPSFQCVVCGSCLMGVDLFQFGVVNREFQPQIVRVGDVKRHTVAMIGEARLIATGLESIFDPLLGCRVTLKSNMARRTQLDGVFILIGILEKSQCTAIAQGEKRMTVRPSGWPPLGPSRLQRQSDDVFVKLTGGFLIARDSSGMMQASRSAHRRTIG